MMLAKEKITKYKNQLEKEREKLLTAIKAEEKPPDFGSDIDSYEEEAEEAEEFSTQVAIAETLRKRVNQIDLALNKIHGGKYGACEKCGREISQKVLDAAPESRLCQRCKQTK